MRASGDPLGRSRSQHSQLGRSSSMLYLLDRSLELRRTVRCGRLSSRTPRFVTGLPQAPVEAGADADELDSARDRGARLTDRLPRRSRRGPPAGTRGGHVQLRCRGLAGRRRRRRLSARRSRMSPGRGPRPSRAYRAPASTVRVGLLQPVLGRRLPSATTASVAQRIDSGRRRHQHAASRWPMAAARRPAPAWSSPPTARS